jgi:hypothetical protein
MLTPKINIRESEVPLRIVIQLVPIVTLPTFLSKQNTVWGMDYNYGNVRTPLFVVGWQDKNICYSMFTTSETWVGIEHTASWNYSTNTFTLEWFRHLGTIYFTGNMALTSVFIPAYYLLQIYCIQFQQCCQVTLSSNEELSRKMPGRNGDLEQSTPHSGIHWASSYQSLSSSVNALCQVVHIYLLRINSVLLAECVMVKVRIVQKSG